MRYRILAACALGVAVAAAGIWFAVGKGDESAQRDPEVAAAGFAPRFAAYEPATEPNGDLSKVVWPDYVLRAGPEVKRLYEFQVTHGELMRYMPCFCGCFDEDGHRSNRDCYVERVNRDGSVVFDSMAPT